MADQAQDDAETSWREKTSVFGISDLPYLQTVSLWTFVLRDKRDAQLLGLSDSVLSVQRT